MSVSAAALLRPNVRPAAVAVAVPTQLGERRSGRLPAVAMVDGAMAFLATAGLAVGQVVADRPTPAPAVAQAVADVPTGPLAITLSGPGDVTVLNQAYEAGKDSGWHAHGGIHAVAVLSGTLTVYDERCGAQTLGPGQSYVGGQERHLVVNETAEPVHMVVTYLNPAGPHDSTRHMPRPAQCG